MLSNKEVSSLFKTLAGLMELHGENDFKTKSYSNAAFQLGRLNKPVLQMTDEELDQAPGIGKSVITKIHELKATGTIQVLEDLYQVTPPGIIEILGVKGLGGKKVAVIWKELGVETIGELLYACNENRLVKLKGFGEKTQQSVIQSIEYYQSNLGKFHFATVAQMADDVINSIRSATKANLISLTGAIRRKCNVIDLIEILIGDPEILSSVKTLEFLSIEKEDQNSLSGKIANEVPFKIYFTDAAIYHYELFRTTGSISHVEQIVASLNGKSDFSTEEEIYTSAGLDFISPEFREEGINFSILKQSEIITSEDIKGVVHNHSTWSDGKNTLEEMVKGCIEKGFSYFVISDHSKTAVYAGGLREDQIIAQHKEIDELNKKYPAFKIFKSIECDILYDGRMDYDDSVLKTFDLVIASVHQNLKMDEEKATARLLSAIENPYTTILGHMTGRLILSRPGYPVNHKKIIDACAANHVIIEINANPWRLDIDHSHIPYALEKGVMISVNPDAHSIDGIDDIHWGVTSARKGGLTKQMTLNAKNLDEFESWLNERKIKRGIGN